MTPTPLDGKLWLLPPPKRCIDNINLALPELPACNHEHADYPEYSTEDVREHLRDR